MNTCGRGPCLRRIDITARFPGVLWRIGIKFVGTLQFTFVLETLCLNSFFAFCCFRVQLLGFCRLPIRLGRPGVGFSLCALSLRSLLLDFGLSGSNIVFGFGSLLPNLRGLFTLAFALLRRRLTADCDDDPDDDQDHDDGDDDPDDG